MLLRTPTFASLVVAAAVLVARGAVECRFCFRGDRLPSKKRRGRVDRPIRAGLSGQAEKGGHAAHATELPTTKATIGALAPTATARKTFLVNEIPPVQPS